MEPQPKLCQPNLHAKKIFGWVLEGDLDMGEGGPGVEVGGHEVGVEARRHRALVGHSKGAWWRRKGGGKAGVVSTSCVVDGSLVAPVERRVKSARLMVAKVLVRPVPGLLRMPGGPTTLLPPRSSTTASSPLPSSPLPSSPLPSALASSPLPPAGACSWSQALGLTIARQLRLRSSQVAATWCGVSGGGGGAPPPGAPPPLHGPRPPVSAP